MTTVALAVAAALIATPMAATARATEVPASRSTGVPQEEVLYGVYSSQVECISIGGLGTANGTFKAFKCVEVTSLFWFLYVDE